MLVVRDREHKISSRVRITPKTLKLTFDDAVRGVVSDDKVNGQRSMAELERRIRLHLTPFFGGKRLTQISALAIQAFVTERLGADASAAEVNRELSIIRRAFRLAVESEVYHGRIPKIRMLKENNVRQGFFDDAKTASVLAHLPTALRPVVQFAYVMGWRVQSEVLALQGDRHVGRASAAQAQRRHLPVRLRAAGAAHQELPGRVERGLPGLGPSGHARA